MKTKLTLSLLIGLAAAVSYGQAIEDLNSGGQRGQHSQPDNRDRVEVTRGQPQFVGSVDKDGGVRLIDKSSNTEWVQTRPAPGKIHRRKGRPGECAFNYYAKAKEFRWESLEGHLVDCDQNDVPFRKVSCGNVLLQPRKTKLVTNNITREKTIIRETTYEVPTRYDHYHTEYTPGPTQFVPLIIMGPQQQYIGNLGAPTVIAPQGGGISLNMGGNIKVSNNVKSFGGAGGAGGNGYGAAAAAAAAAASSSSTSATPTSAAGTSGGSSSGGSAGSGGGPSKSGSGS